MEKTKKAAAISYDPDKDRAPRLTAAGRGLVAEKIVALAREFDVPVREDRNLATLLEALEIDTDIPEALYRVVAEVMVYIYELDNAFGKPADSGKTRKNGHSDD